MELLPVILFFPLPPFPEWEHSFLVSFEIRIICPHIPLMMVLDPAKISLITLTPLRGEGDEGNPQPKIGSQSFPFPPPPVNFLAFLRLAVTRSKVGTDQPSSPNVWIIFLRQSAEVAPFQNDPDLVLRRILLACRPADVLDDLLGRILRQIGMLSHLRSCERYDEPETLPSLICLICPTSADGGQFEMQTGLA
jgi:hypothetical protein